MVSNTDTLEPKDERSLSLSDTSSGKSDDPDAKANLDRPNVVKQFEKKPQMTLPRTEKTAVQKSPADEKEKQHIPNSAPPGNPSGLPRFDQDIGFNDLTRGNTSVMSSENGKSKKRARSMSVPAINITSEELSSIIDKAKLESILKNLSDASSSGDESDQGQGEEDALLKPRKPQPSSTTLKVPPQRFRRKSVASCGPLRPDGGKLSSGSSQNDFAVDFLGTTSMNNTSIRSPVGSLSSDPNKVVKDSKRNTRLKLKRQASHDNAIMEVPNVDDDEPCEAAPLLEENTPQKGPVAQPQQQDDNGAPAYGSYHPLQQYGGPSEALDTAFNRQTRLPSVPNASVPNQNPEPVAKCDIQSHRTFAPRTGSTSFASSHPSSKPIPSAPSSSGQPGGHGPQANSGRSGGQHSPPGGITNIYHYHGTVIDAKGGRGVQIALGNNSNQVQQGASGKTS